MVEYELAIIGGGPAGYTAGIYASRSGIKCTIFDRGGGGGKVNEAPIVENYTGFSRISGMELTEKMKSHVQQWTDIHFNEEVHAIKKTKKKINIVTSKGNYGVKAVILCTGTRHRTLGIPGEEQFLGRGVSYCATCDGFFFKGKKVVVVGGGNSALIEALYLHQIGCEVTLVHRRDILRGEVTLEKQARDKSITVVLENVVEEIRGEKKVEIVKVRNTRTNESAELQAAGVFVSIGDIPQSDLAQKLHINLDDKGYIKVDDKQRTNIKGIYAAGDVTGGIKQIITACAQGATAALTSSEVLGKLYPYY